VRSTKLTAHLYPFATPHIHSHSEEGASFTGEQMRRVVDAAEAGVRDRMERKVLKAASMGYTRGVRQGEAQAKEEFVKEYPSRGGGLFDESNGTNADVSTRALAPEGTGDTKMNLNQSEELASLRNELETLRNAVAATAGGSVAERDDAGSVFSEDSAVGTAVSASARDVEKNARKPPVPPGAAVHFPTRIPEEDSAKEHSDRETPSTPDKDASDAADDEPNAFSARSDGGSVATSIRPKGSMPTDAGRMPDEVFVGRRVVGGKGKTYGVKNTPRSENGEGGGAPTAALWALSVSARDGKIPTVRHDALDLISSRCQLFFAHDKLSRATLGWAAARWRLACAEPRRRRAAAAHFTRRRARRVIARCFAAWAVRGAETEETATRVDDAVSREARANESERSIFHEFTSPVSAPPPRLDRDVAAGLVDQLNALRGENRELSTSLADARDALESSGPTPREAAQSEKFRAHLQRLQRELEATKQARDVARDSVDRAAREAAREATTRRQSLKATATQTGGPGDLSGLALEDQDAAAAATALELRAQAGKFHVEFERQAQIAEAATSKLRDETSLRARMEDSHRRELSSLRDKHVSDLASARSEWAREARVGRGASTDVRAHEARFESRGVPHLDSRCDGSHDAARRVTGPSTQSPETTRLTADRLVALECQAGTMRDSENVEEKVKGWEARGVLAQGVGSSPPVSPGKKGGSAGASSFPLAPKRGDPEDAWGDFGAGGSWRRRDPIQNRPHVPRPPASVTGSERSTRSRAGTAAAVVAAVRAGGVVAVDALLASGVLDASDDEEEEFGSRPGSAGGGVGGARAVRRPPASATLAVAQLVMRGHGKADAETAVAAVHGNDVDAAHEWLRRRARNGAFISGSAS
jgi:hypothetical protein